jgi:hypothetical protein
VAGEGKRGNGSPMHLACCAGDTCQRPSRRGQTCVPEAGHALEAQGCACGRPVGGLCAAG